MDQGCLNSDGANSDGAYSDGAKMDEFSIK